jgi:peptidoglycan/LPS O-acetylase OafA/YrhL
MLRSNDIAINRKTFFLDILRGLAALYVLIGHARWLLWEGYTEGYKSHPETYNLFAKIQVYGFNLFAFGHQAVMLFFVLSGFVIHYSSYNQSLKSGSFSIHTYLGKRIKRIFPPFLAALLLTFILDSIGKSVGYTIYFGATDFELINKSIASDLSLKTLLGNVCMLQKLVTPVWGSNGPLWSLMYEWWFYILYIPVFFINKKNPAWTAFFIGLVYLASLFVSIESYPWITVINYFFAWYLGVIVADWYMERFNATSKIVMIGYVVAIIFIASYFKGMSYMNDYYMAFCFTILIYLSIHFSIHLKRFRVFEGLSDFSYTLYVIHMPVLVLLSGWLQQQLSGKLPTHFAYVYAGIAFCMLLAWGLHYIVETPFIRRKV